MKSYCLLLLFAVLFPVVSASELESEYGLFIVIGIIAVAGLLVIIVICVCCIYKDNESNKKVKNVKETLQARRRNYVIGAEPQLPDYDNSYPMPQVYIPGEFI